MCIVCVLCVLCVCVCVCASCVCVLVVNHCKLYDVYVLQFLIDTAASVAEKDQLISKLQKKVQELTSEPRKIFMHGCMHITYSKYIN